MPPSTGARPPGRRELQLPPKLQGKLPGDAFRIQDQINLDIFLTHQGSPVPHGATHAVNKTDPLPTPLVVPKLVKAGVVATIGVGPSYMREDAQLVAETGVPVTIAMANAEGAGTALARASHVHATPLTTNGDLLTVTGGVLVRLGVDANPDGYVLTKVAGLPAWAVSSGSGAGAPPPIFLLEGEGEEGQPGPPGPPGVSTPGTPGAQGPAGPAIFLLDEAADGEPGPPGSSTTGATGATGAQGPTGPAVFLLDEAGEGDPGVPGPAGAAGAAGIQGAQGVAGPAIFLLDTPADEDQWPWPTIGAEPTFAGLTLTTEEWNTQATNAPQITADPTNNYNPGNGAFFRIDSTLANARVSGITGGVDGRRIRFRNFGTVPFRFIHQGGGSTAANRLILPEGRALGLDADEVCEFIYDATTQRWIGWRLNDRVIVDENDNVLLNTTGGALATTAIAGFTYLPSCAGAPTGVPTAITGMVATVIDSTNRIQYAYLGGAWVQI